MNCMKCGRETGDGAVFCEKCLNLMKEYPVKPGTPVVLPPKSEPLPVLTQRRRPLKPEEKIARLRKLLRWNQRFLLLALIALALVAGLAVFLYIQLGQIPGVTT